MAKLNKIKILSLAKFQAILLAPVGLITGIIYSFGGTIYDIYYTGSVNFGTALAYLGLIIQPIMFAAFGYALGIIEALLYNLWAKKFGGIEVDL